MESEPDLGFEGWGEHCFKVNAANKAVLAFMVSMLEGPMEASDIVSGAQAEAEAALRVA